ncbi:G-type lectin S-receptor-like serine/threonine-protein kinase B120 isoform X2 [Dendrobium catenatum]|uniref:G-type lectin S-receptor-like serine/threonine-protein kinase B120 isoform X2 n=1 Tax=Dendrobium catenatum TaxID=906689 RepID=UPI00109F05C7|nr:G-type lectin S-receptor-like serine/threonine-protein kinase B120 isoform X2 [Dendrobium catenatum]
MGGLNDLSWWALISSLLIPLTQAASFLELGQSLTDGHTLSSSGGSFHLGFFSLDGSGNRFVGIWQGDFFPDNVVWVANRNSPIPHSTTVLSVSGDGNLVIVDGQNRVFWSTNVSLPSNDSTAELTDYGDLMLNSSGDTAWESFSHPTNTYLPGMKVGFRLDPDSNQVITSWNTAGDPAPGNFSLGVDPSSQLFIWEAGLPRWRSGPWNGQVFVGIPGMMFPAAYGFTLSNFIQGNTVYYYTGHNSSHRWVLTPYGTVKHLVFSESNKTWLNLWEAPVTECEKYNMCGNFGSCSDGSTPICSCLKGFVPRSKTEWERGHWTGGCVRKVQLQCDSNVSAAGGSQTDKFYLIEGVKLPDLGDKVTQREVVNLVSCAEVCSRNCSCRAYFFLDSIGCMIWAVDLVDINVFSTGGNDLYLRVAASEFNEGNKKKTLAVYIIVIIVSAGVFFLGGNSFLFCKWKGRREGSVTCESIFSLFCNWKGKREEFHGRARKKEESKEFSDAIEMQDQANDRKSYELPLFSFSTIVEATGSFSQSNFLGKGGFGSVFKGKLPEGQEIAVKRLSRGSGQGSEEFKNEVTLIAKLQHRNLVRLLGFCTDKENQLLVYEYMPNKSLDAFLFGPNKKGLLDWKSRYRIIEGIARGLLYLHRDSRLRIIHRDLKASNILLDAEMNPKISDFGLARIFRNDSNETTTKRVVGTYGYMAPEYAMQGLFSVKSDVYSFGVLLLEITWRLWTEENLMDLVDPTVRDSCSLDEVSRCINVGLLCVQDKASDRPTMASVVMMLESGIIAQPIPKRPKFSFETNFSDTKSHSSDIGSSSNNTSITILTGR